MNAPDKLLELNELAARLGEIRAKGGKIAHCHGVFDLLHIGHIRHFQQARRMADVLVVTLTADRHINKGPHRPAFPQKLRAEALAALGCIDFVAVSDYPTAVEILGVLRPDFYVKGKEYEEADRDVTGGIVLERQAVEAAGGKLVFTDDIVFSSSNLINRYMSNLPDPAKRFLDEFRGRVRADDILAWMDAWKKIKILILGETIIDEYHYCETMGKSGKEPILAARFVRSDKFAGGVLAVANHLASFCDAPRLLSALGTADAQEKYVRQSIRPNVEATFLRSEGPTIVKRRFLETYPLQKMFEIYIMRQRGHDDQCREELCKTLDSVLDEVDLVVVCDYGHGLIGPEAIDILCRKARFLAVNTQINAGNYGFNTISKYPRADFVSLSEKELRMEARSRRTELGLIVEQVARQLGCKRMYVTQGEQGSLCYSADEGFFKVPAFSSHFVDRVGAGDAVFALTSLCSQSGLPMEVTGFIGNVVGSQAVLSISNSSPIERKPLCKHIVSLLK